MSKYPEVIIGLVCQLGCDEVKKSLIEKLKMDIKEFGYNAYVIKITDGIFSDKWETLEAPAQEKLKSFHIYLKMEICSKLRELKGRGLLGFIVVKRIQELRKHIHELRNFTTKCEKEVSNARNIYIIDQIKNNGECELLNKVYGDNYIQLSLFSKKRNRNERLEEFFHDVDDVSDDKELEKFYKTLCGKVRKDIYEGTIFEDFKKEDSFVNKYKKEILPDVSSCLLRKDWVDATHKDHGQEMAALFDKSHYYVNLDKNSSEIEEQACKFVKLLFGKYNDYPTKDEFGMALAFAASKRSNFPGRRHIGACLISPTGEVISVGSIRAPSGNSNPTKKDEDNIEKNYWKQKKEVEDWINSLKEQEVKLDKSPKEEIVSFLKNALDYHPCTHAEMAAIADAAKLGVSVRGATLYSTTFPCHICAKDIITCGIKRVVFIEPFPKSKNEEMYSNIIEIDPDEIDPDDPPKKIPFETFYGVGPRRYNYVYGLSNKQKKKKEEGQTIPPLLEERTTEFYENIEKRVVEERFDKERGSEEEEDKKLFKDLFTPKPP